MAQRKRRVQLRRVLGQPLVAHLGVPELLLDDPKRVFHLGSNASLGVFTLALLEHQAFVGERGVDGSAEGGSPSGWVPVGTTGTCKAGKANGLQTCDL